MVSPSSRVPLNENRFHPIVHPDGQRVVRVPRRAGLDPDRDRFGVGLPVSDERRGKASAGMM